MSRTVEHRVTVLRSLVAATSPGAIGYLANIGRFAARHPELTHLHGTTHNEAFHRELKSFYRNVMTQSKSHAILVAKVVTFAKLVSSVMQRGEYTTGMRQVELLKAFVRELSIYGLPKRRRVNVKS